MKKYIGIGLTLILIGIGVFAFLKIERRSKEFDWLERNWLREAVMSLNSGVEKYEQGEHFEAIVDFDEAIRLEKEYALAYFYRGQAKYALGEYREAIRDYGEVIRLEPQNAYTYYNIGLAYSRMGLNSVAIENYDVVIRLAPNYASAYNTMPKEGCGSILRRLLIMIRQSALPPIMPLPTATED